MTRTSEYSKVDRMQKAPKCPACGAMMFTMTMTEAEEKAQAYPNVIAKYRCSAWPECGTTSRVSGVAETQKMVA